MASLKLVPAKKRSDRTDSESNPTNPGKSLHIPKFVEPMSPTLVDEPPAGTGWLHEIKYDGYRTEIAIGEGGLRAFSRNGHDWTSKYGPILDDARAVRCRSALIDGEVCVQDERGVTDFAQLPGAIRKNPARLIFFAFDLLHLDGEDLRAKPLEERRAKLRWLLQHAPGQIRLSDEFDGDGAAFFELADQLGLEGIVSKRKGSRYSSGDSSAWLKTKCWHTQVFNVVGVDRDAAGIPYALLADETGYRGSAFVSLPNALRDAFWKYVEARGTAVAPVRGVKKAKATWLKPGLRASVRYLKGSDKLRHAAVRDIRIAKD